MQPHCSRVGKKFGFSNWDEAFFFFFFKELGCKITIGGVYTPNASALSIYN